MESFFWSLIGLCCFGYIGYPVLLYILFSLFGKKEPPYCLEESRLPSVSILIAAFNEEKNIRAKLGCLLNQDYPPSLYDIWLLDDGSTDATLAAGQGFDSIRIKVLALPRSGKAAALNKGVRESQGEILVFSDADTLWQPSTLKEIIKPFCSEKTGAVAGRIETGRGSEHLGFGDKIYHSYESAIRWWETALAGAVSADGGLFAVRRNIWEEVPPDVTDDFFISTAAVVKNTRIVFARSALAFDTGVERAGSQLRKRVRITVRGLTSLWRRRQLFAPWKFGLYSFFLLSHKLIRRLVPAFALLLLPLNALLVAENAFYLMAFGVQFILYCLALLGLMAGKGRLPKIFSLLGFLVLNSFAVFLGLLQFLMGKRYTHWIPEQNR